MGGTFVLAFFLAIIWMATEIPIIGPILKVLLFAGMIGFCVLVFQSYQDIKQEKADRVQYSSSYR